MGEPEGFSWILPRKLAGMKFPTSKEDYTKLPYIGIGLIVCLNETIPNFDLEWMHDCNLRILHVPIDDCIHLLLLMFRWSSQNDGLLR